MGTIRVFDPTSRSAEQEIRLAPRPASLHGLRVALVENTEYSSSALLLRIAEPWRRSTPPCLV